MANFNKVTLAGNLTRDPELHVLPSGLPVFECGLAINHRWTDRDGNPKEEPCFVDIRMYGKRGEILHEYVKRGDPLLVHGRLRYETWTGRDGSKRSKLFVVFSEFEFIGKRRTEEPVPAPAAEDVGLPPPSAEDLPF